MEKVILTKEQIEAIENLKDGGWDDEHIIKVHKIPGEWHGIWSCLNDLPIAELHRVLQYGYQTKEDYIQELEKNADKCEHDTDNVNKPSHYNKGKYEAIDIILDVVKELPGDQAALVSNILKYVIRYPYKNGLEDLKKCQWYLNKLIEIKQNE